MKLLKAASSGSGIIIRLIFCFLLLGGTIPWPFLEVIRGKPPGQNPFTPFDQIRDIRKIETYFGRFLKNVVENQTQTEGKY